MSYKLTVPQSNNDSEDLKIFALLTNLDIGKIDVAYRSIDSSGGSVSNNTVVIEGQDFIDSIADANAEIAAEVLAGRPVDIYLAQKNSIYKQLEKKLLITGMVS